VLHGGGNTSVKAPFRDIFGNDIPALYVKGSGWDLASIEKEGFSPVRPCPRHALVPWRAATPCVILYAIQLRRTHLTRQSIQLYCITTLQLAVQ